MFSELTNSLMSLHKVPESGRAPNVIFGSVRSLAAGLEQKTPIRIALMPALSTDQPQLAMGLMAVLGYLLENYQEITVYRQFVRLAGDPADFEWNVETAQFSFEDWHLEPLDDNTTVWATLQKDVDSFRLIVEAESDLPEEDIDAFRQEYTATSLSQLVDLLPQIARDLAVYLTADLNRVDLISLYDADVNRDEMRLETLLQDVFHFEVDLLLQLWGKERSLFEDWARIQAQSVENNNDTFALWLLSVTLRRLLLPGMADHVRLPDHDDLFELTESEPLSLANFARGLAQRGDRQVAIEYMVTALEEAEMTSDHANLLFVLGDLYVMGGQLQDGVSSYEEASQLAPQSAAVQLRAAQGLSLLDEMTASSGGERTYTDAIIDAYDRALGLDTQNRAQMIAAQITALSKDISSDASADLLTRKFEALIAADEKGQYVSDLLEDLYSVGDVDFDLLQEMLEAASAQTPDRIDRKINLATAYILSEDLDRAALLLEETLERTTDPDQISEIQRLMLYADDPDFEAIMGEMIDKIGAKTPLDETEIDYLEQVVEVAPHYTEAHQLLAQGYQLWNDAEAVMDTLLDAVKQLPNDAEILVMLAKALSDSEQNDLALEYLEHSVKHNPMHIPSLALLGRVLFDMERDDEARAYITQAQALGPRNPAVTEVRAYIARKMGER